MRVLVTGAGGLAGRALVSRILGLGGEREVFGISREVDIPGSLVPEFYEAFLRTGNCGPLVPVVDHNRQDLVTLGHLLPSLLGELHAGS